MGCVQTAPTRVRGRANTAANNRRTVKAGSRLGSRNNTGELGLFSMAGRNRRNTPKKNNNLRERPRPNANYNHNNTHRAPGKVDDANKGMFSDFVSIMQGVNSISRPESMYPVVCLSEQSFPLVNATLAMEDGDNTPVVLPAIGISKCEQGRACVIGSEDILRLCVRGNTESSAFLENVIKWVSSVTRGRITVHLLGFSRETSDILTRNMSGFGFLIRVDPDDPSVKPNVIIVPSSYDDKNQELWKFVESGGGLIVASVPYQETDNPSRYTMNKTLGKCGLGIPVTSLLVGPFNQKYLKTSFKHDELEGTTFPKIAQSLIGYLSTNNFDMQKLDSLIAGARYNIMCLPQGTNNLIVDIQNAAFKFLENSKYITENGICPDLVQSVVSVLCCEIQSKLSASYYKGVNRSSPFPGDVPRNYNMNEVHSVSIVVNETGWYTTGFWLPAGIVSTVKFQNKPTIPLSVQIGMHTDILLSKNGPWNRWPMVTLSYDLDEKTTEIATPFGGIVYIVCTEKQPIDVELEFTIDHVCTYPRFSIYDLSLWKSTKRQGFHWCEIESRRLIITSPVIDVDGPPSIQEVCENLDYLIDRAVKFVGGDPDVVFRLVFDVETSENTPICGYPIIFPVASLNSFTSKQMNQDIFLLLTFIAMVSLPDSAYDHQMEESIAHIAACYSIKEKYPKENPLDHSTMVLSPLFNELWKIYEKDGGTILSTSLKNAHEIYKEEECDCWNAMLNEVSLLSGVSLEKLKRIEKIDDDSSTGLVSTLSSASLQTFQLLGEF